MSKDKKIDSEFETKKSDYSPLVRDTLIMSALELGYRMLYSFYKRYNDDRSSVRLYRSMKNLNSSSLSQLNSEFFKSKQHTTFLHRYPERMQYILSLSQEERSVFMADAIKDKNPHEILLRDTFEDNKLLNSGEHHVLEYILKDKLTGPWNVDPRSHKIMKDLGGDINFDTLLRCLALDNLSSIYKQRIILFTPIGDAGGYATGKGDVVVSTNRITSLMRGTLAHEFYHRGMFLSNQYLSPKPYSISDLVGDRFFEFVMQKTLKNLHQQFMPDVSLPSNIIELSRSLDSYSRENAKLEQEKEIIEVLINSLFLSDGYKEINYHEEFVVRLPELISSLGELPPYIRDAFITLENYYKTEITPKWLEYINDHPNKDMLLVGEMGKYYPETILNFSGEDEILRKEFKNHLSDNEKELVYQIQKMKIFIEGGDVNAARLYLSELKDERVVRESLRICIEQDSPIFNDVLSHIQAPQYLGPQLVLAARLGRNEISTKLLPQITNQYYLARALEIALDNNDQDLVQTSIVGIKDSWFLNRSANKYPDNEIVSNTLKAISFKKSINELRELHSDKSDIILRISQEPFAHDFSKAVLSCLIRENEDALNKALNILEKPALLAWVNAAASQGPLKINYLKELNQEQLSNVIEILLEPQFRDWNSGSGSYEIIDYVINLDKPKRDIIFKVLSGFEEFDYHDNLKILSEFNPEQQNSALEILKKLNKEDVGKLLYALNRVNNAGEGELNNALKVLEVLEFKTFICNDPRDQKVIVKDRSNNPFASFSNKFDSPNVRKKLDCLMALDKEQINIVLESLKDIDYSRQELFLSMLGSRVAISHAAEDFSKLVSLVQLPKEELENLLGRDARDPIIALALEHIMPPMVSHVSIVASNNMMISGVQGGVSSAQMSDLGATNIAPQFALAATTAKLALGVRGYFSNLLAGKVVTTNSSSINHDAMDMENKLQSLSSKFKELYDKNVEEYTDIHIKEGKHLKDLHNKARDTLNRLNKFNKRSKSEVEEVLLHDAKEIFTDYKKLKKELKEIKQLQNAKSLVHVNGLEDKLKEAGVHVAKKPISFVNRVKPASRDNSRGY